MAAHVVPVGDEQPHTLTADCPCGPDVEWVDPGTGRPYENGPVVIHMAFDCREVVEVATGHREPGSWAVINTQDQEEP